MLSGFFSTWGKDALRYFAVYLVVGLAVQGTLALVGLLIPTPALPTFAPGTPAAGTALLQTLGQSLVVSTSLSFLVSLIATSFVAGGVTDFAVRRRNGEAVRMTESLRRGISRLPSVLGAGLVYGSATTGIVLLALGAMFAGMLALPSPAAVAFLCGGIILELVGSVAAIYFSVVLVLYAPPIMIEGRTAIGGLRRSWSLTKGHRLSLFGAIIVVGLLGTAVALAEAIPALYVRVPFLVPLVGALAIAMTGSWTMILAAVAYDLILRESGLVPRQLARSTAGTTPQP